MKREKLIYDFGTGEMILKTDQGEERILCFKLKAMLPHSEFSGWYWPRKKSDRKLAISHFKETGEMIEGLNED